MAATSHSAVLAAMAARITSLDASAFEQGDLNQAWTEAISPFGDSPTALPDSIAHLGFVVFLASSRPTPTSRQSHGGDGSHGMEVESAVDVVWTYFLRHDNQVADYRLALNSAQRIVAAVLSEDWSADASALCVEAGEPRQIEGEPWLLIRTSFLVSYEIGV